MNRKTKIRLAVAASVLLLATAGGWIARRGVKRYVANRLIVEMAQTNDVEGIVGACDAGANIETQCEGLGRTSLHHAASHGYTRAAKVLLEAGADVNALDIGSYTPLHLAALGRHIDTMRILIAYGANVNAKNGGGETAIYYAAYGGNVEMAKVLTESGADVDTGSLVPLHWAAKRGLRHMVQFLIEAGADVNGIDGGETPLDSATDDEVGALLRKNGAKTAAELKAVKK